MVDYTWGSAQPWKEGAGRREGMSEMKECLQNLRQFRDRLKKFDLLRFPDLMRVLVVAPPLKGELQSPKNVSHVSFADGNTSIESCRG